ncbi:integrase [Pseudomonas sp. BN414]|uniref:Mu transposase C-terminal domain-containing protein n=1 Tax=Pseudomonas sp. BN414 TaxID=2567888 RepID=UPI0024571799|nr:Mu transposase C-terminal domain-containing protein [Pseudomonas sp. BN414]MDH4569027.1 integrase [Pseudomonas sp. BN414]
MTCLVVSEKNKERIRVSVDEMEFIPARNEDGHAAIPLDVEEFVNNASIEDLEVAQERFRVLRDYLAKECTLSEAMAVLQVSRSHFHALRRRYDETAGYYAFIRFKRGIKKSSRRLSETLEGYIQSSIDKVYSGKAATIKEVWRDVEKKCIKSGYPIPSYTVVRSRVKSRSEKEIFQKKHGAEAASQTYGAKPGHQVVNYPLEKVQMDHTMVDVILVDDQRRLPLGRPWLTVIIDLYTRVILGYYLSLHHPSTLSVACAVANAALPKHIFLKSLGIDSSKYPFYGVPEIIQMDNAKEFKTPKFQRACKKNRIKPEWRPYGRKHYGGHVERLIGTLMTTKVHFLPGATFSNVLARRGYDSEKKSALTFKEFTKWFAREVCIYHGRHHAALGCSPASQWKSYFDKDSGRPVCPPIVSNSFAFKLDFMPEENRVIGPQGIKLHGSVYWDSSIAPYVGRKNVPIKYDPFSMGKIWAWVDDQYIPVHFSNVTRPDFTYEEYRAGKLQRRGRKITKPGGLEDESLIALDEDNVALVNDSIKLTKRARKKLAAQAEYRNSQICEEQEVFDRRGVDDSQRPDYSKRAVPIRRGSANG